MAWVVYGFLGAAVVVWAAVAFRNASHNYTVGSGMFKSSKNNLNADEHVDPCDYNYYDNEGKFR